MYKSFDVNAYLDKKYEVYRHYEIDVCVGVNNLYIAYAWRDPVVFGQGATIVGAIENMASKVHLFYNDAVQVL